MCEDSTTSGVIRNSVNFFFSDTYYLQGLKTSLIIAVIATVVSTTIGVSAAIGLDRYQGRGKQVLESLFLSPLVVPAVVIGFAILMFFAALGIFDGFTRLLGGHLIITFPYTVRTTLAGLVGIRKSLTEAAMNLGTSFLGYYIPTCSHRYSCWFCLCICFLNG